MVFFVFPDLLDDPGEGGAERLVEHRSAGFADGFQTTEGPLVRTVPRQLTHGQGVRQHDRLHVPGLALSFVLMSICGYGFAAQPNRKAAASATTSGVPQADAFQKAVPLFAKFDQPAGEIRALNGASFVPIARFGTLDLSKYQKLLAFPVVRTIDVPLVAMPGAVDVHYIFPNFNADPDDPANYRFEMTDDFVRSVRAGGSRIAYRLGESIELYKTRKYFIHPPADFAKYGKILANIARHYNDGWANGFKDSVAYWEIWNEPDNRNCWTGTPQQFYELYEAAAKAIKQAVPSAKVGGPSAMCGAIYGPWFNNFLKHCREHDAPLEFFSFDSYGEDPMKLVKESRAARKKLNENGFTKTEIQIGQWSYHPSDWKWRLDMPGVGKPLFENRINGAEGAAYSAVELSYMQDAPIDEATFYYGGAMDSWGLFSLWGEPRKPYYAFLAFKQLLDCPRRVQAGTNNLADGLAILAGLAKDSRSAAILISRLKGPAAEFDLSIEGLPWQGATRCRRFVVDKEHNLTLTATEDVTAPSQHLRLSIPAASVYLLRLDPRS